MSKPGLAAIILYGLFCFLVGNLAGDMTTEKDCRNVGQAKMVSGEYIKCEVIASAAQHATAAKREGDE